jgi:hypothetical protein
MAAALEGMRDEMRQLQSGHEAAAAAQHEQAARVETQLRSMLATHAEAAMASQTLAATSAAALAATERALVEEQQKSEGLEKFADALSAEVDTNNANTNQD